MSYLNIERSIFNIDHLEILARKRTPVHKLDSRVKLITTIIFIVAVISFEKYEIAGLMPFFFFPLFISIIGDIPSSFILKKILLLSPFILFIVILNPFIGSQTLHMIGPYKISSGWISSMAISRLKSSTAVTSRHAAWPAPRARPPRELTRRSPRWHQRLPPPGSAEEIRVA